MTIMTEYVDDELPLPPFAELFGEGMLPNKRKLKKFRENPQADETTGRWTPEEHRLFLEGIMLYGKDWKKMQPLIKSRSLVQIRTHAQKVFKKIGLKKALMMSTNKRVKIDAPIGMGTEGSAAPSKQAENEDYDGDDTMVGAEELQLLQQMSAQMIQEEVEDQRRQRQTPHQSQQQQQSAYHTNTNTSSTGSNVNEFQHLTAANIGMVSLPSAASVASSSGAGVSIVGVPGTVTEPVGEGASSLLPEHAFHQSYDAAYAAYIGNSEYQGGYSSDNHEQGVDVILQYANSGEGNPPSQQNEYSVPDNQS